MATFTAELYSFWILKLTFWTIHYVTTPAQVKTFALTYYYQMFQSY
jgi:hypothetical protein